MNPHIVSQSLEAPAGDSTPGGDTGATGTLAQARQSITRTARDAATQIKSTAADTAARAKEKAGKIVEEKKETTAHRIGNYGSAIHESARALEQEDPNIAWFTHRAADRLNSVADYVRTRDFTGLREDAENLARRHPAAFFGGLFVAGLILGNVFKASRPDAASEGAEWEPEESLPEPSGEQIPVPEL